MLLTAVGPRRRLWERRRHDADALTIRVGTGDVDSEVVLDDPDQLDHKREQTWIALDVPVTVPLRERGVLGFAGRDDFPRALARWAVAQSAALHSPADLWVYVLTDARGRESWEWVRWLPHARPADGQDALALIGADADSIARRVSELVQIVTARRSGASPGAVMTSRTSWWSSMEPGGCGRCPAWSRCCAKAPRSASTPSASTPTSDCLPEECQAVVVQESTGVRVKDLFISRSL